MKIKEYMVQPALADIISLDFPGTEFRVDQELLLYGKYVRLLQEGKKSTTVRYSKNKIRVPSHYKLPLFMSKAEDKAFREYVGRVKIDRLVIKTIDELTEQDGVNDGFSGKSELVGVIEGIYGKVALSELVSIYRIRL